MADYDAERAIDVFEARDDLARPLTASDVANALGWGRRTALNKLNILEAAGRLTSRDDIGGQSRVFWVPIPADGTAEGSGVGTVKGSDDGTDETTAETDELGERAPQDTDAALDALGLDGDRQDAVRAMRDLLRRQGTATKSDYTDLYDEHKAGYGSAESWWKSLADELGKLPGAEQPEGRGKRTWYWVGETE